MDKCKKKSIGNRAGITVKYRENTLIIDVKPEVTVQKVKELFSAFCQKAGLTSLTDTGPTSMKASRGSKKENILWGMKEPFYECTISLNSDQHGTYIYLEYDKMSIWTGGGYPGQSQRRRFFKHFFAEFLNNVFRFGWVRDTNTSPEGNTADEDL